MARRLIASALAAALLLAGGCAAGPSTTAPTAGQASPDNDRTDRDTDGDSIYASRELYTATMNDAVEISLVTLQVVRTTGDYPLALDGGVGERASAFRRLVQSPAENDVKDAGLLVVNGVTRAVEDGHVTAAELTSISSAVRAYTALTGWAPSDVRIDQFARRYAGN